MHVRLFVSAVLAALATAAPVVAQDASTSSGAPQAVIRASDEALSCVQIADEAAALSQTMGGEPDAGVFGSLGGMARAGAAALIPGAGLLMAGADALSQPDRERREAQARALQHRWYYLNGLYAGRRCLQQPEARDAQGEAPAKPPAPVVVVSQ